MAEGAQLLPDLQVAASVQRECVYSDFRTLEVPATLTRTVYCPGGCPCDDCTQQTSRRLIHRPCSCDRHELPTDDARYERERQEAEDQKGAANAVSHSEFMYL